MENLSFHLQTHFLNCQTSHAFLQVIHILVVQAKWTAYIDLDSSVVDHLNSDAGVPGLIPGPAINFHLYFFVYIHSSHPYYNINGFQ